MDKELADYAHVRRNLCDADDAALFAVVPDGSGPVLHRRKVRCRRCGLVYSDPQASDRRMRAFYSTEYPHLRSGTLMAADYSSFFLRADGKDYITPGRFLEVGCAEGARVLTAQRLGWDAYGLEISESFCETARSTFGLENVFCGAIQDARYPSNFFDYIIVWHVLEHVADPSDTLSEIARVLAVGGVVNLGVPNIAEPIYWAYRVQAKLGGRAPAMATSGHQTYEFTPNTLQEMLRKAGLSVQQMRVYWDQDASSSPADLNWKGKLQIGLTRLAGRVANGRCGALFAVRAVKK